MAAPSAPTTDDRRTRSVLLVALLCLVWSSTWWAIRICLEEQPPLTSAAVRFLVAGLAMAALAPWLQRREAAAAPPVWLWLTTGTTNFALSYGVLYVAETVVPSGIAAVLWAVFPLLMAGSAVCFLGERLAGRQWLGFLVSFAGIVLVFAGDLGGIGDAGLGHACFLLLSPLVSTVGTTLVKRHGSRTSSVVLNRNAMLVGAALLGLAAALTEDPANARWTARGTIALAYLSLCGTTMTFGIYFWLLRTAPASLLSLISYVTPVLAMLLAAGVGDGTTDLWSWLGAGAVVLGVALVVRRRR